MASDGEVYAASTAEVMTDVTKKRKGKKNSKKVEKVPTDPAPSDAVSLPTAEVTDDEQEELPKDVTPRMEWIARVKTTRQAVELLGHRLNQIDGKFKTLEEYTLEENDNIRKDLDEQRATEEEAHASLDSMVEALEGKFMGMLEALSVKVKELEEAIKQGRYAAPTVEREARIEAP